MQCQPLTRTPTAPVTSFDELVLFLDPNHEPSDHPLDRPPFPALHCAILAYNDHFQTDFYTTLWPRILDWASHSPASFPPTGLSFGASQVSTCGKYAFTTCDFDTDVARYILANMFVLNVPRPAPECGNLDLHRLMQSQARCREGDVGAARLECLLAYFHTAIEDEASVAAPERTITIERREWISHGEDVLMEAHALADVKLMETSMESALDATRFVNFANQDLHIHRIIPSATQEEVLFSCAPEAYVAIGVCPRMQDNHVILIRNVRRYAEYTGYLSSFKYLRRVQADAPRVFDILSVDAVTSRHFTTASVDRDVGKATLAMRSRDAPGPVVTGHWGCGVFGGNKTHKFIQQWVAASRANVATLHYSVFGDIELMRFWTDIVAAVHAREWTPDQVAIELLGKYSALSAAAARAREDGWVRTVFSTMAVPVRSSTYEEFVASALGLGLPGHT